MIYALLMIVILDNTNIPEKTYHNSLQECVQAGKVIAKEHYLEGADKVYIKCKGYGSV